MSLPMSYDFDGKAIEFFMGDNLLINATRLAANYPNRKPADFLRNPSTVELLAAMKKLPLGPSNGEIISPLLPVKGDIKPKNIVNCENNAPILITYEGKEYGATWMHRYLAIDFAAWLDVNFKLWLLAKIDYLLTNFASEQRSIIEREADLRRKRSKLIENNSNNPAVMQLAEFDEQLKDLRNSKTAHTKKQYRYWNNELNFD